MSGGGCEEVESTSFGKRGLGQERRKEWVWMFMPAIPALGDWGTKISNSRPPCHYTVTSRLSLHQQDPVSKQLKRREGMTSQLMNSWSEDPPPPHFKTLVKMSMLLSETTKNVIYLLNIIISLYCWTLIQCHRQKKSCMQKFHYKYLKYEH